MSTILKPQTLALSFDRPTVPITDFIFSNNRSSHRFSMGWYNLDNRSASVNTAILKRNNAISILNDPVMQQRYSAGNMIFGVEKKVLDYSMNNRDWLIVINLLNQNKNPDRLQFTSIGQFITRSNNNNKIYASWLMTQLFLKDVNSLAEMGYMELYDLFEIINADNPCTIMLSDGHDTCFYQGSDFTNSLYFVRSCPPHENTGLFRSGHFEFLMNALDFNHTVFLISSEQIAHKNSMFMNLNQMMVVRSGEIVFNKDPHALWERPVPATPAAEIAIHHSYLHRTGLMQLPCKTLTGESSHITIPTESTDKEPRIYSILHRTVYEYDAPVYLSKHLFRLQPLTDMYQALLEFELVVLADGEPVQCLPCNIIGAFGNNGSYIKIEQPYTRLEVICNSKVSILNPAPKRFDLLRTQNIPIIWMPWDRIMMEAYLVPPELPESELSELSAYALSFVKRNNNDLYEVLHDINRTIYSDYVYQSGSTTLQTTAFEVYANHRGVCQDFANLFICLARLLNIPARYRTGYVYTAADYDNHIQGDASHAWLELFLPNIGWQGFDPTNFCLADKNHIRLACGRTYRDAAPTSGTIFRGGGTESMTVDVKVLLLNEFQYGR